MSPTPQERRTALALLTQADAFLRDHETYAEADPLKKGALCLLQATLWLGEALESQTLTARQRMVGASTQAIALAEASGRVIAALTAPAEYRANLTALAGVALRNTAGGAPAEPPSLN